MRSPRRVASREPQGDDVLACSSYDGRQVGPSMCQSTRPPQHGQRKRSPDLRPVVDHGGWSSWAWSISYAQRRQNRNASVTGPPIGRSTAGRILGTPGPSQSLQRNSHNPQTAAHTRSSFAARGCAGGATGGCVERPTSQLSHERWPPHREGCTGRTCRRAGARTPPAPLTTRRVRPFEGYSLPLAIFGPAGVPPKGGLLASCLAEYSNEAQFNRSHPPSSGEVDRFGLQGPRIRAYSLRR